MFIDLMDSIISESAKFSCENTNQKDFSCHACNVTSDKASATANPSISSEPLEPFKHTTKGVSPFVGQMFGYLYS